MEDRILTLHPEGKEGVYINKAKYTLMREAIIESFEESQELTFKELRSMVSGQLEGKFQGSIGRYFTTVKLDLEARNIIQRRGRNPQYLRLINQDS